MPNKNWTGDTNSVFKTLGASNHSQKPREENDYYATSPVAVDFLMQLEHFENVLEPSCGEGHLSNRLKEYGVNVFSSDKIDRNYGAVKDFFNFKKWHGDIITNPPYKYAQEFVEHALKIMSKGRKLGMFLKLQFLEGRKRAGLFKIANPKRVYVSSKRIICAKNADFKKTKSSAIAYAWFIWEKGYQGETVLRWFNDK